MLALRRTYRRVASAPCAGSNPGLISCSRSVGAADAVLHQQWNEAWREFWSWFPAGHPQPTREDIEEKAAEHMEAFNLLDLYIHEHGDGSGATGFVR